MKNETPILIKLTEEERLVLTHVSRSLTTPHRDVVRAQTILLLVEDYTVSELARRVGRQRRIVRTWAWRFLKKRLDGLLDAPRSGRPPRFSPRGSSPPDQARL